MNVPFVDRFTGYEWKIGKDTVPNGVLCDDILTRLEITNNPINVSCLGMQVALAMGDYRDTIILFSNSNFSGVHDADRK